MCYIQIMNDPLYHERLMDHYYAPRNFGLRNNLGLTTKGANPLCGDSITVQLLVCNGIIMDLAFEHEGCVVSRAAASLSGEFVKLQKTATIRTMKALDMLQTLNMRISPGRIKCATLFFDTIHKVL